MFTPIVNGNIASLVLLAAMGAAIGACVHSLYIRILLEMEQDITAKGGVRSIARHIIKFIKGELKC